MISNDVYQKIRKHLAEMNDIQIITLGLLDHHEEERFPGYIVSLIAERLTCLYFAIQTHRKTHSQSLLSFRDSLIHMLYLESGQLIEPSKISVNLALVILAGRLTNTAVEDLFLFAEWRSKNHLTLSALPDKTKLLAQLHWHDLPSELFQDLAAPQSPASDAS